MGPVWFQIEVCTTREIKRVKRHKANNTTNNYGLWFLFMMFCNKWTIGKWCIFIAYSSLLSSDFDTNLSNCPSHSWQLSTTWSVRKPASFIRFSHNPTPQSSLQLHVAESIWKQLPLTMHENTVTQHHRLHLKTTTLCLQGFSHSFEAVPAANMLMLPSCDQRLLFLVRVFESNSRCLALLINTPVSWSIWAMKIETQGFCSTWLRLSDLKVNHDCMRCPGTVHQNVVVCDNVWPRHGRPPKKTVLFTFFHSPPIQGNKKIKKGRPNHRLPQRLQSSCNLSIQRCDFFHFAQKFLHFCMSFLSSLGSFIKDGQGVGTTPNFQNHFITTGDTTGELCCKKHVYHQTIWT